MIKKKFLKKVLYSIDYHHMINKKDYVLICVSGGPDSVALLHCLVELKEILDINLGIAHLNHKLRGDESDLEEEFVLNLSSKYDIKCYNKQINVKDSLKKKKMSLEEKARYLRYNFFKETADKYKYQKIATAHHADDNAEQVLISIIRGSGPLGLSGIPPIRDGIFIRPLIKLNRSDIINYLNLEKLTYVIDKSNFDNNFLRNKIRNNLLPLLKKEYNSKINYSLNKVSAIISEENQWIDSLLIDFIKQAVINKNDYMIILDISYINKLHNAPLKRIIRTAVKEIKKDLRRISFDHIDQIIKIIFDKTGNKFLNLPDSISVYKDGNNLIIFDNNKKDDILYNKKYCISIRECGDYSFDEFNIKFRLSIITDLFTDKFQINNYNKKSKMTNIDANVSLHDVAFFDMNKVSFPLFVRNFLPGDKFSPFGTGGTQKLKKFFIDKKIPKFLRKRIPLIISNNKIIWIVGLRIDNSVKITSQTNKILKCEFFYNL